MTHVTFIHGIGNKPPADELLDLWKGTLADHGLDLDAQGVSSQMVYWADLLYPAPLEEAQYEAAETQVQQQEVPEIGLRWVVEAQGDEARFIASLAGTIGYEELATDAPAIEPVDVTLAEFEATGAEAAAVGFERVPIPWWLKRRLMKIFLRDVEHYPSMSTSARARASTIGSRPRSGGARSRPCRTATSRPAGTWSSRTASGP